LSPSNLSDVCAVTVGDNHCTVVVLMLSLAVVAASTALLAGDRSLVMGEEREGNGPVPVIITSRHALLVLPERSPAFYFEGPHQGERECVCPCRRLWRNWSAARLAKTLRNDPRNAGGSFAFRLIAEERRLIRSSVGKMKTGRGIVE
jgi:hypothetical protein